MKFCDANCLRASFTPIKEGNKANTDKIAVAAGTNAKIEVNANAEASRPKLSLLMRLKKNLKSSLTKPPFIKTNCSKDYFNKGAKRLRLIYYTGQQTTLFTCTSDTLTHVIVLKPPTKIARRL